MSLKYYADEQARYGEMGSITEAQMKAFIPVACAQFKVPHVELTINPRKTKTSCYKPGAMMIRPDKRVAKTMGVPTIDMAHTMMVWVHFLHEFAHHVHTVRYHEKSVELAKTLNKPIADRLDRVEFVKTFLKKQHYHGHDHRVIMQKLVDFFLDKGISAVPTYILRVLASPGLNDSRAGLQKIANDILRGNEVARADAITRKAA